MTTWNQPSSQNLRPARMGAVAVLLGAALLTGCATRTPAAPEMLQAAVVQIGPDESSVVQISFEQARAAPAPAQADEPAEQATDKAAEEAAEVASGQTAEPGEPTEATQKAPLAEAEAALVGPAGTVVLSRGGEEFQRIEHDFGMDAQALGKREWARLEDLSGNGWKELILPREDAERGMVDVVYAFNVRSQRYEPVQMLSGQGEVRGLSTGCVLVESAESSMSLCHLPAARRWVRLYAPGMAEPGEASALGVGSVCVGPGSRLADCRQLRLRADRTLQESLAALKQQQRDRVAQAHGRQTAARLMSNLDAGHRAWLNYRDNRCMGHAREQGLVGAGLQMVFESCRHQMAMQQRDEYLLTP